MFGLDASHILMRAALVLPPLLLSLTVHEWAHAWSAFRLGDDTAARMGRLTLNPLAHADLLGTVILPIFSPIPFGWAKPVPVNAARFRRDISMSTGMILTAAAGPLANVLLAVACTVVAAMLYRFAPGLLADGGGVKELLLIAISMNVSLALFNLIPIPPLDGSRIVDGLMPLRWRPQWESFVRFAPLLLIAVILYGGRLIAGPSDAFMRALDQLFAALT